jgi:isoquinoline 1-oxidoreductase alpha subunit
MVHVDGVVTHSCITMLSEVEGKGIRTIEGLAQSDGSLHPVQQAEGLAQSDGSLHPVQQAFIDEQAPQCGWCMSGQIMNAAAFLEENPNPTEEEIVSAMSDNYCRCGTYGRIKRAVQRAAREMATEAGRDHE